MASNAENVFIWWHHHVPAEQGKYRGCWWPGIMPQLSNFPSSWADYIPNPGAQICFHFLSLELLVLLMVPISPLTAAPDKLGFMLVTSPPQAQVHILLPIQFFALKTVNSEYSSLSLTIFVVTSAYRHIWLDAAAQLFSGAHLSIKMLSYPFRNFHAGHKMILWPSYLHNGIPYVDQMASFILNQAPSLWNQIMAMFLMTEPSINHGSFCVWSQPMRKGIT